VLIDILTNITEPSDLLPCQIPSDIKTVEEQSEDVLRVMNCYVDSDGNFSDFACGLNSQGLFNVPRVAN
jgi:beta-glucosidase